METQKTCLEHRVDPRLQDDCTEPIRKLLFSILSYIWCGGMWVFWWGSLNLAWDQVSFNRTTIKFYFFEVEGNPVIQDEKEPFLLSSGMLWVCSLACFHATEYTFFPASINVHYHHLFWCVFSCCLFRMPIIGREFL